MFNHILATILGLTAIILGVVSAIKFDFLCAHQYDANTSPELRKQDIDAFLDNMDRTRETRYNDRSRMMRQFDGFRSEWNAYLSECWDNMELA